jgi:hypothetical protein
MPHAELKYSNDLDIDAVAILAGVEAVIQQHDTGAGQCKGRAFAVSEYHHSHVILNVSVLPKAHRDTAFMNALLADLETTVKSMIAQPCAFSAEITFSGEYYVTNQHDVNEEVNE